MKFNQQKGFSLVEVLVAMGLFSGLVILIASIPNSISLIARSKHLSIAREIMSKEISDLRAAGYVNLTDGQTNIVDTRVTSLPSGTAKLLIEDCDTNICAYQEDTKEVTVTLTWKEDNQVETSAIKTLISQGGIL